MKADNAHARLVVNVPPELMEALERAARDNNKTVDAIVRSILKGWLRCAGYLERSEER